MAGTKTDFVIYEEQFFGGMTETLLQNSDAFNGASQNAIRLVPRRLKGDYEQESFMKEVSGIVSRRDITSVADASDLKLEQDELVGVKLNRKIGPVTQSRDAFRKIAQDPATFSFILGQQWGQAVMVDYVDSAVRSAVAALGGQLSLRTLDGGNTLTHTILATGLSKFGDAQKNVICWVMHSKQWFDLVKVSISDKITNIADVTIVQGTAATLGRPTIVTDSAALVVSGSVDQYLTLGLVADGVVIDESEERDIVSDVITGKENILIRLQGEYAFNLRVKGFAWNMLSGGVNPSDAAVGTDTNWLKRVGDKKACAGVMILTK